MKKLKYFIFLIFLLLNNSNKLLSMDKDIRKDKPEEKKYSIQDIIKSINDLKTLKTNVQSIISENKKNNFKKIKNSIEEIEKKLEEIEKNFNENTEIINLPECIDIFIKEIINETRNFLDSTRKFLKTIKF
ncbi:MAG: hypothetical protein SZ59_C0002G0090 [candidate division TM6 bacterium GW2011_GWF2_28_16]|jgi:DNA polymerase III delta prime subunit|nr:MAG: hypothetical protein SZ59_C0002G0090 [candidate division TM6 bacterium GW2011_GWF2_28_16]